MFIVPRSRVNLWQCLKVVIHPTTMRSRPRLPVQLVPITTKISSSNPVRGELNSIQHYVIKFVEYPIINDKNVPFFFGFPPMFLAQMMIHLQNSELPSMPFFFLFFLVTWSLNQAKSCSAFSITFSIRMSTSFSNIFVFVCVPWLVLLSFYLFLFFLFSSFRKCVTMMSRNDFIIKVCLDRSIDISDHLLYILSIFQFYQF